jgi:large subunit ribosomal protein L51
MARLKDDPGPVVNTFPRKPDPWHPKVALYGQNDFIDILGDGSIHPTRIMTNVPKWLRGVDRKTNEIAMINRRIQIHPHWKSLRPEKYYQFRKRIDFLFRYLNGKKRPPPPDHY